MCEGRYAPAFVGISTTAVRRARRSRWTWAAALLTLSNRLFAAAVMVAGVLVVCALALWFIERNNPQVSGPVSGFSYVSRALIEGSTPWPLTTPAGRVVHEVVLITGRSVLALATGAFASKMVELVIKRGTGMEEARASGHIVICGWSSKGSEILRELRAKEVEDPRTVVVLATLPANPSKDPQVVFVHGSPPRRTTFDAPGLSAPRQRSSSPTTRLGRPVPTSTRAPSRPWPSSR